MNEEKKNKNFWSTLNSQEKYRAINDLVLESQASGNYYALLVLSSVVIASGLLLANSAILIGGMLITPLLTPILLIALGIVTSKKMVITKTALLILKSVGVIFAVSFIAGLVFSVPKQTEFFDVTLFNDSLRSAFLYFLVALASGVAATFAWIRKEITNILPGISIAVSLVPPIALVGVWFSQFDLELARFFLMVFLFNLFGIIVGSMGVFSTLRFYGSGHQVSKSFNEVHKDESESIKNTNEKNSQ